MSETQLLRIKEILEGKNMSTKDFATKAGLSYTYASEVVRNVKFPRAEKLIEIARALNVDLRELFISTKDKTIFHEEEVGLVHIVRQSLIELNVFARTFSIQVADALTGGIDENHTGLITFDVTIPIRKTYDSNQEIDARDLHQDGLNNILWFDFEFQEEALSEINLIMEKCYYFNLKLKYGTENQVFCRPVYPIITKEESRLRLVLTGSEVKRDLAIDSI